jgi:hypothetical protein
VNRTMTPRRRRAPRVRRRLRRATGRYAGMRPLPVGERVGVRGFRVRE